MRDAIIRKLQKELSATEDLTERRVVYILAEIRKLLERTGQKSRYYALDFHCSWALHTSMDRTGAVRILKRFDKAYTFLKDEGLGGLPRGIRNEIDQTIDLGKFRQELSAHLAEHELPTQLVCRDWTTFLREYAAVIEDCELTVKGNGAELRNIKRLTVRKEDAAERLEGPGGPFEVFRVCWVLHGKDNRTQTLDSYYTIP